MGSPVIDVEQLVEKINSGARIAIVDCRFDPMNPAAGQQAYLAGHLPGAHYAHLEMICRQQTKPPAGVIPYHRQRNSLD